MGAFCGGEEPGELVAGHALEEGDEAFFVAFFGGEEGEDGALHGEDDGVDDLVEVGVRGGLGEQGAGLAEDGLAVGGEGRGQGLLEGRVGAGGDVELEDGLHLAAAEHRPERPDPAHQPLFGRPGGRAKPRPRLAPEARHQPSQRGLEGRPQQRRLVGEVLEQRPLRHPRLLRHQPRARPRVALRDQAPGRRRQQPLSGLLAACLLHQHQRHGRGVAKRK